MVHATDKFLLLCFCFLKIHALKQSTLAGLTQIIIKLVKCSADDNILSTSYCCLNIKQAYKPKKEVRNNPISVILTDMSSVFIHC